MSWLQQNWLDIVGWGGSALLIFSVMQTRVLRFRVLNLAACVILAGFNALIGIWPMVAMNLALILINFWHIRSLLGTRHDEGTYEVLEVGPTDTYLAHVLRVHEADMRRTQPDLLWDGAAANKLAFLVQRGDETVGVVLISKEGSDAIVELDWVSPRFRDVSPGEFVWRRSGLLADHGVNRVVTSPEMVAPYYERVGFERSGDHWVLPLGGK